MAVSYVGVSSGNSAAGTSTSFVTTLPAGWQLNDVSILIGHVRGTSLTMTTPAGWTLVPGPTWPVAQSTNSRMYAWYRVHQVGDTAPTITNSGAMTGGWSMVTLRGANTSSPIGQVNTSSISSTSLTLPTLAGVLAGSSIAAAVHAGVASGTIPTSITFTAAYTEVVDHATSRTTTNANQRMAAAYRLIASAGSYGGEAVTTTITSSMIGLLVEVVQASSTVTLTDADVTITAIPVTPSPGPTVVTLTDADVTVTAVPVTPAAGPTAVTLTPATTTITAPTVNTIVPGAPWVRDSRQSGTGAGTSLTHSVAIPTCQVGDDLWASFTLNGGHGAVTDPVGWTRVFPTTITDDGFMTMLVYRKTATSTEVAGGNITVTVGTAVRGNAGAVSIANADTGALDGSVSASGTGTATTSTSFSTTTTNTLVLSVVALDSGTEVATPPTTLTERWNPTRSNITGQSNAGATALKAATGSSSWNWTWPTSLAWKSWAGAVKSVSTGSSVTLTPAVMTTSATSVTAASGPTSVTLTSVTSTTSAIAVAATPGATSVTLTPITCTVTASPVTATPGVTLTPITRTITAVPVTAASGPTSVTLTPVAVTTTARSLTLTPTAAIGLPTVTVTAIPVTASAGPVSVTLTPAVIATNVFPLGVGGVSVVALSPAQLTTSVQPLTVAPGAVSITLTPAVFTATAFSLSVAVGAININIVPAQATITPGSLSFTSVRIINLVPAQITISPIVTTVGVTTPGVDLMTIAFATVTGVGEYIRGELEDTEGGVPARFALIVPGEIAWDNCDCGQFAQSITNVVSSKTFPIPATDQPTQPCGHPQAIVSVTVSLLRCIPGMDNNGNPPDVRALFTTARIIEEDRQALRRALNCYLDELQKQYKIWGYTIGNAQSVGPQGQCGGVEIAYSFGISNDAVCCG